MEKTVDDKASHVDALDVEDLKISAHGASPYEDLDSIEQTPPGNLYVWRVSVTAALGGSLFGYDTGVISGILIYLGTDLDGHLLSAGEKELITAITSACAFFGAIVAGSSANRYGRKLATYIGAVFFIIGAVLQACAFSVVQMTIGRGVLGLGVGSAAMIVPLYIAEISPAKHRGRMLGLNAIAILSGQMISNAVGAAFAGVPGAWRYLAAGGAIPAILLLVLLPFCPESPRMLVRFQRSEEAASIIRKIFPHATELQVEQKVQHMALSITAAAELEHSDSRWQVWKKLYTIKSNFRALFVSCWLMALTQLGGFNSLMYYGGTLFSLVGFSNPLVIGIAVTALVLIGCILNAWIVDRVGRRTLLLISMTLCSLCMFGAAITFRWIPISSDLSLKNPNEVGAPEILVLVFLLGYCACSLGAGNISWMCTEFFPMDVRALATTMITCTNWAMNCCISAAFLSQMEAITPFGTFLFYASIGLCGAIGLFFLYPEVSGMTLENIQEVFSHGWGYRYAAGLQREMKARRGQ